MRGFSLALFSGLDSSLLRNDVRGKTLDLVFDGGVYVLGDDLAGGADGVFDRVGAGFSVGDNADAVDT